MGGGYGGGYGGYGGGGMMGGGYGGQAQGGFARAAEVSESPPGGRCGVVRSGKAWGKGKSARYMTFR